MKGKRFGSLCFFQETRKSYTGQEYRIGFVEAEKVKDFFLGTVLSPEIKVSPEELGTLAQAPALKRLQNFLSTRQVERFRGKTLVTAPYKGGRTLSEIMACGSTQRSGLTLDNGFHVFLSLLDLALSFKQECARENGIEAGFFPCPDELAFDFDGAITYRYPFFQLLLGKNKGWEKHLATSFPWLLPQGFDGTFSQKVEVYSFMALFLWIITGEKSGVVSNDPAHFAAKKLWVPYQGYTTIPEFILPILAKGFGGEYRHLLQVKEELEGIVMEGDVTPTTFNLAFYVNSLFKEEIRAEIEQVEREKVAPVPQDEEAKEIARKQKMETDIFKTMDTVQEIENKRRAPIFVAVAAVIALIAVVAYMVLKPKPTPPPPQAVAAQPAQPQVDVAKLAQELEQKMSAQYEEKVKDMESNYNEQISQIKDEEKKRLLTEEKNKEKERLKRQQEEATKKAIQEANQQIVFVQEEQAKAKVVEQKKAEEQARVAAEQALKEGDTVSINDLDFPLKTISQAPPRVANIPTGGVSVTFQILIGVQGKVEKVKVLKVSPPLPGMDKNIELASQRWEFSSPVSKGMKVKVWKTQNMVIRR